jgi:hypothetical protein
MDDNDTLYPLTLYIYDEQGFHDKGITLVSDAQLNGPGTWMLILDALNRGVEIRITDPNDFLVFLADEGNVLFPPPPAE